MRKVLITGGSGFIGTHFLDWFSKRHPTYFLVNLDKLTYAARPGAPEDGKYAANCRFVRGDVCDLPWVEGLFRQWRFDGVIHLAAETHVDRSIADPLLFTRTNATGTAVLLQAAYDYWFKKPHHPNPGFENHRFLYVSTDEVYGSLSQRDAPFTEESSMAPNNPYSASKAAAECLVRSYGHTYGLNTVVTRGSNTYGPGQYREKLIPMILHCALRGSPIWLHGTGGSVRDWLHVKDHCRAIDALFHRGATQECYNVGACTERTNLSVAQTICLLLDAFKPLKERSHAALIAFCAERPGQDQRYALNAQKITQRTGWKPTIRFEAGIRALVREAVVRWSQATSSCGTIEVKI